MLSRRRNLWFRGRRRDGDVRTKFFEPHLRDAVNGKQVFDALERTALLAKLHDCLRRAWADSRQLLKLLERGCIHIDRLRRRLLLRAHEGNKQHARSEKPARCRSRSGTHFRPPCASYSVTSPKRAAWSAICSRSPTRTICALAESKWRRAAERTSSAVSAPIRSR